MNRSDKESQLVMKEAGFYSKLKKTENQINRFNNDLIIKHIASNQSKHKENVNGKNQLPVNLSRKSIVFRQKLISNSENSTPTNRFQHQSKTNSLSIPSFKLESINTLQSELLTESKPSSDTVSFFKGDSKEEFKQTNKNKVFLIRNKAIMDKCLFVETLNSISNFAMNQSNFGDNLHRSMRSRFF